MYHQVCPVRTTQTSMMFQEPILLVLVKLLDIMRIQRPAARYNLILKQINKSHNHLLCYKFVKVWHYCSTEGLMESFLCPNGTIYSQERRVCEWYYDVDCERTNKFLDVNKDLYIIPNTTRTNSPRSEQLQDRQPIQQTVQQTVQQPPQQPAQFTNKRKRFTSW